MVIRASKGGVVLAFCQESVLCCGLDWASIFWLHQSCIPKGTALVQSVATITIQCHAANFKRKPRLHEEPNLENTQLRSNASGHWEER